MSESLGLEVRDFQEARSPFTRGVFSRRVTVSVYAVDGVNLREWQARRDAGASWARAAAARPRSAARLILRLIDPTGGSIRFGGEEIAQHLARGALAALSGDACRSIFQDPYASLNPRMTVGQILGRTVDASTDIGTPKDRLPSASPHLFATRRPAARGRFAALSRTNSPAASASASASPARSR